MRWWQCQRDTVLIRVDAIAVTLKLDTSMDTNTTDIRGRELHFIKRVLNRQQHNELFSVELLKDQRFTLQSTEEFFTNLQKNGLLRFENGFMYATNLAIRSIKEKEKIESRLIEEQIIDDFEYAFLMFMKNRNEPVHLFDFPPNFKYHSKIDGQPVPGTTNTFYDWMDEVHKYIHDPTIDGYILNHTGEIRFEKLKNEKALKAENERLDIEAKRQTIEGAKFSRNVAYASLGVAAITALVPLFIWLSDKDKTTKTQTDIPQLQQVIQTQSQIQQNLQDLQISVQNLDTNTMKIKVVK